MPEKRIIRSPFFYVGDKYKLMSQITKLVPKDIGTYIEPFVGGGSSFLNSKANNYILNDYDPYVIELHKEICKYIGKEELLFQKLFEITDEYGLSCSFNGRTVPEGLKEKYKKTYYAKYNKESYIKLRDSFNEDKSDILKLYVLLIYGFNHMIRFNSSGKFNLPVGNVDFNKNVYNALNDYLIFCKGKDITFYNYDYEIFLKKIHIETDSYVFLDPPYIISFSEYNKLWDEAKESRLCSILDSLNKDGIKFGITNLIKHKGRVNESFYEWAKKYYIYNIDSNYISFNDNTIKKDTKEIFVTNYVK